MTSVDHTNRIANLRATSFTEAIPALPDGSVEIAFILDNIADWQTLALAVRPGVQVVVLDSQGDGLAQMAQHLADKAPGSVDAIHLLSHGSSGNIQLGATSLNALNPGAADSTLAQIGKALSAQGDFLLYGCDVADGALGQALVTHIAQITQADVFASTDITGSAPHAENWVLEFATGEREAASLFGTQQAPVMTGNLASLAPGAIAVLGFNADQSADINGDGLNDAQWAIVALSEIPAGTIIHITDAGIKEDGTFFSNPNNDGHLTWTVTSTVPAGTILAMDTSSGVNFNDLNGVSAGSGGLDDYGNVSGYLGGTTGGTSIPFATAGDQIIIYQGTAGTTAGASFIYAFNTQQNGAFIAQPGTWQTSGAVTAQPQSYLPTGLFNGTTANALTTNISAMSLGSGNVGSSNYGFDNMAYQGPQTGTLDALLAAIATPSNWVGDDAIPWQFGVGAGFQYANHFNLAPPNASPTLTDIATMPGATEDTAFTISHASLLDASDYADADAGDPRIFRIEAVSSGTLTKGGVPVQGGVTLLNSGESLVWTPLANANGSALDAFTVRAWDGAAASASAVQVSVNVAAVNDAPTLSGGPFLMTSVDEDTTTSGYLVSTMLGGVNYSDVDTGAPAGIAVTATSGRGTWQYSTDGSNWTDFGAVSNTSALLLAALTLVRYQPDEANGENVGLTFRAWDGSSGTASTTSIRSLADTSSNGGSTAFSAGTAQSTLEVTSLNDAPVMNAVAPTLTPLSDSAVDNAGELVGALLDGVSDVDMGALQGIAITGVSSTYGKWQFSINAGGTWNDVGDVSPTQALLLRSTDKLRFAPDGLHGETPAITYKAWDQSGSTGVPGSTVDTSAAGGMSAYSLLTDTATLTVTAVNDAPVLAAGASGNAAFTEGANVISMPVVIDDGIVVSDPDSPALASATVKITNAENTDLLDLVAVAQTMGDISASWDAPSATLSLTSAAGASPAQWQAALRAVTYTSTSDNPDTTTRSIEFRINDGSLDSSVLTRSVTVDALNDAPVNAVPDSQTVKQDATLLFSTANGNAITVGDVDGDILEVTLTATHGTLTLPFSSDVSVTSNGGSTNVFTVTVQGNTGPVNAVLQGLSFTPTSGYLGSASITVVTNDSGFSGSDGPKTDTDTIDIMVNPSKPSVSGTSALQANGSYKAGDTLTITVTFDQDVNVDITGGVPVLLLDLGLPGRVATYSGGSGGMKLSFSYTVRAGDNSADLDYLGTAALQLHSATIRNADGDDAILALPAPGTAGSLSANKNIAIDTMAPTQSFSALQFSHDTGDNTADFITNTAVQTITATLSAALGSVETLYGSLDDGATWIDITASVLGTALNWDNVTLTASGTLRLKVIDAAGNEGTPLIQTYVLDSAAPVFNPSLGSPADNASAVATSAALVLNFGERLGSADAAKIYLHDTAAGTTVAIAATIDGAGRLVITPAAALKAGTAYHLTWDAEAILDVAGNAAVALGDATMFNFTTAQPVTPTEPTTPTEPSQPSVPPVTVDGASVTTTTRTDSNGVTTTTTRVAPVTPNRNEDPNTPHSALADVPLAKDANGNVLVQVGLPTGVGVSSDASSGANLTLRDQLMAATSPRTLPADFAALLQQGIDAYVPTVGDQAQVMVRTLTFSTAPGATASSQPIVVQGTTGTGESDLAHPLRQEALVIDARALPAGSVLDLSLVEFAIVIGAVKVIGGEGRNFAIGDASAQTMILGADDDILHGGGGNDTVGSLGGNDQVFGDAGNDIVFGGTGHDTLSGGTGNDRLDGGLGWDTALQAGSFADYTLTTDGQFLVFTHRATGEVDRLKSIEQVKFDSGPALYIADSEAEAAVAHIATRWLGLAPTPEQGAWAQQHSELSALQVAQVVLQAAPALFPGLTAQQLIAGLQDNAQIVRMDVIPELNQGTAGHDELRIELHRADVHLERTGTDRWEATSLIDGNMAESIGIERLHLKDVSVALDVEGTAGQVAGLLAVLFGTEGLTHQGLAGAGLAALDSGMSVEVLGGLAIDALQQQQGHAFTAQELVQLLWTHATGSAGTQQQLQPFAQQLQSGEIASQELVGAAAQYALAHPSVELVGVLESGLLYTA